MSKTYNNKGWEFRGFVEGAEIDGKPTILAKIEFIHRTTGAHLPPEGIARVCTSQTPPAYQLSKNDLKDQKFAFLGPNAINKASQAFNAAVLANQPAPQYEQELQMAASMSGPSFMMGGK